MTWACAAALRSMASRPRRAVASSRRPPRSRYVQPDDRGERRAQLVGEGGEELVLDAAGRFRLRARPLRLPEQPLALLVVVLALRDVARERAEAQLTAVRDRGDGQLQREEAAVAARRLHLQAEVRSRARPPERGQRPLERRSRASSGRISSARRVPMARSRGMPNVSSACGFQKVTCPAASRAMTASSVLSRMDRTWAALDRRRSARRSGEVTPLRYAARRGATRGLYHQLDPQ